MFSGDYVSCSLLSLSNFTEQFSDLKCSWIPCGDSAKPKALLALLFWGVIAASVFEDKASEGFTVHPYWMNLQRTV